MVRSGERVAYWVEGTTHSVEPMNDSLEGVTNSVEWMSNSREWMIHSREGMTNSWERTTYLLGRKGGSCPQESICVFHISGFGCRKPLHGGMLRREWRQDRALHAQVGENRQRKRPVVGNRQRNNNRVAPEKRSKCRHR